MSGFTSDIDMIKLTKRLEAIKNHISPGAKVVDVGTDHGLIPVFLAESGCAAAVTATDINIGPLTKARELADRCGVSERIRFVLTDGLRGICPDADTVIIAGMGGETIMGILEAAPWVLENGVKLLLQPQSKITELAEWLSDNKYTIFDAELVKENGKFYHILEVKGDRTNVQRNDDVLNILLKKRDPLFIEYIDILIRRANRVISELSNTDNDELTVQNKKALDRLIKLKEEAEKWQQ